MPTELYNDGTHKCLAFTDLVAGEGIQSNQFLIIHGDHDALIDPGGELTFTALSMELSRHIQIRDLEYIIASHQDPDIIASIASWLSRTNAKVVSSHLWSRFLPHLIPNYMDISLSERCICLPDSGGDIRLGDAVIKALPAHFLHSVGNFHFYDPIAKILFSGDVGASSIEGDTQAPVSDFAAHIPAMRDFHRRYMVSNKACRLWANMIRDLDVQMIVPQHGPAFIGPQMIGQFLDWMSELKCGVDLMNQSHYCLP